MKHNKDFRSDVSKLIVAFLAIMAFLRGTAQFIALVAVFFVWAAFTIYRYLIPYLRELTAKKTQTRQHKKNKETDVFAQVARVLLRHIISEQLFSSYPDAKWEWCDDNPEQLVSKGGTKRIKLEGVLNYNYAEVTFSQDAEVSCQLLHVAPMENNQGSNKQEDKINPQIWYEQKGKQILSSLIADLNSRGYNSFTIEEDGNIAVQQQSQDIKKHIFDSLPDKTSWPQLAKILESSGIAAEVTKNGIVLSW